MQTPESSPWSLPLAVLRQAADAVIFSDREGIIRLWNQGAEALFGHTAAQAEGRPLDLIIPDSLRRAHGEGYARAMAVGELRHAGRVMTTRGTSKSGGRLYVDFSFSLVRDEAGAVCGAVAIGRDCTARWLEDAGRRAQAQEAQAPKPGGAGPV